ncbi:leucine-rich repeat-containing protein 15-like [Branchiostoma floridae]|uniref:Leucine-rich repeat-containing protein 15-like n=1 Tax=Branchiostoma floridae TaxID=7739 RepID=A0A9J7LJT9_BRAFL|nr:leucine-rich repeat-containing protein 15-like [Branchiostoma floridae]
MVYWAAILAVCMTLVRLTTALQACTSRDGPGVGVCSCSGTTVNCYGKNLASIPDGIPATTTSLTLWRNQIVTIENTKLQHLHSLILLDIDNNEITSILSHTFAGLQNLQIVYLENNNISIIEPRSFISLNYLTKLDIRNNEITSVVSQTFAGLRNLQWLKLSNNAISVVEQGSFQHLQNLTELHIENNEITIIFSQTFAGLRNLKQLYLNGNHIKDVQPGGFQHLQELTTLRLDNNKLKSLRNDIFSTLEIPGEESTEGHQYQSLLLETRDHNYTALWTEDATFDDQDAYRRQEEDRDGPECSQGDMAEEAAKPEESDEEPTHSYQNIPHDDDYYNFPTVRDV